VERIGDQRVQVNVMVGRGDSPHTYEPKPEQLKRLASSSAYMLIGVEFEDIWLDRISGANPNMRLVDTSQSIDRIAVASPHLHADEEEPDATGEDGEEGAHEESEGDPEHPDPHIWLSPSLAKMQAQSIYDAMVQLDPDHQDEYSANLQGFLADIDSVDRDIRETLKQLPVRRFMVFHPSWGYFARDYGLEMIPVEIGGQEPSAAELAALIDMARAEQVKVIFAQPELSTRAAQTIADEIDGEVVLVSPLAEDWMGNLRNVADAFSEALSRS
jgi:zinc transport system substrate-binding protein